MPTLPGPRLYVNASGSIGHVMTATSWRGCPYWRSYSYHTRGKTAAQAIVKRMFADSSRAWKLNFKNQKVRDDWNRSASYEKEKMSGYDQFVASAYTAVVKFGNPVFVKNYMLSGNHLTFEPGMIDEKPIPTTSQNISFWIGYNPWKQSFVETRQFHSGLLSSPIFPGPGTYYIRMTSDGIPVSGLIRIKYTGSP